ncbi:type II toxin-antitoxin system PemK/MazF family toxin [Sulfurimonas sp.]
MNYNQYEIVIVNLNPTVGSEIQKTRPCLIISPNEMNFSNIIVAPMTSTNKDYPTRVKIKDDSYVVLDQIRTISVKRVINKTDMKLTKKHIKIIKDRIKTMLVD